MKEVDKFGGRMISTNFISHCRRVLLDAIHYRGMFVSDMFISMLMMPIACLFNVTKNVQIKIYSITEIYVGGR